MPQSLSSILTHLVFSTKNREHWLQGDVLTEIHPYLAGVLNNIGCPSIQVGGVSDMYGISHPGPSGRTFLQQKTQPGWLGC